MAPVRLYALWLTADVRDAGRSGMGGASADVVVEVIEGVAMVAEDGIGRAARSVSACEEMSGEESGPQHTRSHWRASSFPRLWRRCHRHWDI